MGKGSKDSGTLQAAALVVSLGLGGAYALFQLAQRRDTLAGNAAAAGQLAQQPAPSAGGSLGGLLPVGTTAPAPAPALDPAALLAEAQRQAQAQADALLRNQRIDTLRRDLARIWNDMDVLVVQANSLKAQQPPQDFQQAIASREWAKCREGTAFGWVVCNDGRVPPLIDAAVKAEWAAKIANDLKPIQAQLSRLNAEQLATVDNLRGLGFQVPAAEVKKVTV